MTKHLPSQLWHCWWGHQTSNHITSAITHNVSIGIWDVEPYSPSGYRCKLKKMAFVCRPTCWWRQTERQRDRQTLKQTYRRSSPSLKAPPPLSMTRHW